MEILRSAFRHGIDEDDIQHALRNALVVEEVDEDPPPDRAGNPPELVDRPQGPG